MVFFFFLDTRKTRNSWPDCTRTETGTLLIRPFTGSSMWPDTGSVCYWNRLRNTWNRTNIICWTCWSLWPQSRTWRRRFSSNYVTERSQRVSNDVNIEFQKPIGLPIKFRWKFVPFINEKAALSIFSFFFSFRNIAAFHFFFFFS